MGADRRGDAVMASAVHATARRELARSWRSLVVLGLIAGAAAGVAGGGLLVARRTATAYDRLLVATSAEDVRVTSIDDAIAPSSIVDIELVERAWIGTGMVAKVADLERVFYVGILTGPRRPPALSRPVVVAGRWYDDERADEVAVSEALASELGVGVGDELPLWLLSAEEIGQFDTGFGDPDGARVRARITGVFRAPEDMTRSSPVYAGAAFHEAHRVVSSFGTVASLRLEGGRAGVPAFRRAFDLAVARAPSIDGDTAEFTPAFAAYPELGRHAVTAATRATVVGVLLAAAAVAVATLVLLALAFLRLHAAGADGQRVEHILGMTPRQRLAARLLAGLVAAFVAGTVAAAVTSAAGGIEPLGRARDLEPSPGWLADPGVAFAAGLVAVGGVLGLTGAGAAVASRGPSRRGAGGAGRLSTVLARAGASAVVVSGVGFATGPAPDGRGRAVRSASAAIAIGACSVVTFATIGAGIDAIAQEPARYGADADLAVIDTRPADHDALAADPRVGELSVHVRAAVRIAGGTSTDGTSVVARSGTPRWTAFEGRAPTDAGEAAIGALLARELELRPGGTLRLVPPEGGTRSLRVVGVGAGPNADGSGYAREVLLRPETLKEVQLTEPFTFTTMRAAHPAVADDLAADLASRYELAQLEPPPSIDSLLGARWLAPAVTVAVGSVALVVAAASLVTAVRRRARDLEVLRVLGMTPADGRSVARTVTLTATSIGLGLGVPVGWLAGRLAWWAIAHDIGTSVDVPGPVGATSAIVGVTLAVAWVAGTAAASPVSRRRRT